MATNPDEERIITSLAKHSWFMSFGKPVRYTSLDITYSFENVRPGYYENDHEAVVLEAHTGRDNPVFSEIEESQKTAFNLAEDAWAAVANITFTSAPSGQIGQIALFNVNLLDTKNDRGDTITAGSLTPIDASGDIFLQSTGDLAKDNKSALKAVRRNNQRALRRI